MINPMLCEKIDEVSALKLNKDIWKANIKYDGERIIAVKKGNEVLLINRRNREKSWIYPEITEDLKKINDDFICDGEVITIDGLFNSLQHRSNLKDKRKIEQAKNNYPIVYLIFDFMELNGKILTQMPLKNRIEKMENNNFENLKYIGFCAYEEIDKCLDYAKNNGCEGIVIKNMNSVYEEKRSRNWLKLKLFKEDEMKAIRYTINPKGIRVEDEDLNAVQIAGEQSREVKKRIDELGYCLIEIQYLEKTNDNRLRFPSFRGMK